MDNGTGITPVMSVGGNDGFGLGGFGGIIGLLAVLGIIGNGGGLFGNNQNTTDTLLASMLANNNGFNNAIGYENLATSNEVQRGFDNQNQLANEREILAAVNSGTAQAVAATNQTFHDTLGIIQNRYDELARDLSGIAVGQAQSLANQNECCCATKMLIAETGAGINANIAQNRYEAAMNTAAINANTTAQTQKILDAMAQNRFEAMQSRINQLELQQAVAGVVRYPMSSVYTSGCNPFCNC